MWYGSGSGAVAMPAATSRSPWPAHDAAR